MTRTIALGRNLQVLIHHDGEDAGIAELVFGPDGGMPATDAQAHAALGTIWSQLAKDPEVQAILIRSTGKGFCAGGTMDLVDELIGSDEGVRPGVRDAVVSALPGLDPSAPWKVFPLSVLATQSRSRRSSNSDSRTGRPLHRPSAPATTRERRRRRISRLAV